MAASGAMADFGRMPTGRKVAVFVIIGLVGGLLYWRFGFKSLREKVDETQVAHQTLVDENKRLEGDIPKFAELRQKMAELQKTIDENQKALPTEAEVPHFFETLERKMTESGVEITKWKKGNEEPVETFVKVPVEIELVGTFQQLKRFFASLVEQPAAAPAVDDQGTEERERIVSIENLSLSQPAARNREMVLTAKFTAVTFRQDDSKDKKDVKAPAATKAGAMAPANTPAGAKERTEDAMKKAEQRGGLQEGN